MVRTTDTVDQILAGAEDYLSRYVTEYRETAAEHTDVDNVRMLADSLLDMEPYDLAPLLAVAVRRLATKGRP